MSANGEALLSLRELAMHFEVRKGLFRRLVATVRAVDGVSFDIHRGETFGLVGESGCGKTTIGRTVMRAYRPTAGSILFRPEGEEVYDLAPMEPKELRRLRLKMQMIFQDPYSSLSPRMTVRDIIAEPLRVNGMRDGRQVADRVSDVLAQVGLNPQYANRYPHAFSGGQRQRIGIARALALNPRLVIADEPVSALDVSVQAQILELLLTLKEARGLSYLFISHDLSVVKYISDRIGVMYVGRLVELADTRELFARPLHPYTGALLSAIPSTDPTERQVFELLPGEVADPSAPPSGCYFHPRCRFARDICRREAPEWRNLAGPAESEHRVACHFAGELDVSSPREAADKA